MTVLTYLPTVRLEPGTLEQRERAKKAERGSRAGFERFR